MKNSFNKGFAWLPILVVVAMVLVGGGMYWYKSQELKPNNLTDHVVPPPTSNPVESSAPKPSTSDAAVPGMQKYTDARYGFSFQYPSVTQLDKGQWDANSVYVSVKELNENTQTEGLLKISAVPQPPQSDEACFTISHGEITINGVVFDRDVNTVNPVPATELQQSYATVFKNVCYTVTVHAYPSACVNSGCTDRRWSSTTENAILQDLTAIVYSLKLQ